MFLHGMQCWDIWVVVSLAMPQHKHVQTQTVLYVHPILYILHLLRCHSFDFWVLSSRGSIISNRLWAKLTSLCCILYLSVLPLCHSESSESSGVFSVLFAPIWISGREPFVPIWVSNRIYLCLLRWSALRVYLCIVCLICGACWAYAPCSALNSVSAVLRFNYLHSGTSTLLLVRGSPNSPLAHFHFITITTATCHTRIT